MINAKRQADEFWMKMALKLAQAAADKDEVPVGAVLIDSQGKKIAQGYNLRETLNTSLGHAEILALHRASKLKKSWRLPETTLYVTLEPCNHWGKTPPCAPALISAGVKIVFVAMKDPNPIVAGRGIKALKKAGLKVHVGLGEAAARELNRSFGWELPVVGPKTISGLIVEQLEMIPETCMCLRIEGYPIEVIKIEANTIDQVRIWPDLYKKP